MFATSKPISDVCLLCQDIGVAIDFYQNKLGLKLRRRAEGFADFETSGVILALWESAHFSEHVGYRANADSGSHKVMTAIELASPDDIDATYATLTNKGVVFINPPKQYPWNAYCIYLHDPDNNLWEFYAWLAGGPDDYHTNHLSE